MEVAVFILVAIAIIVVIAMIARAQRTQSASILLPRPRSQTALQRTSRRQEPDDAAEALAGLLLLVGAAWLGSKVLKAGFAFLKEVDWDRVNADLRRAIEQAALDVERQPDVTARLDRAEQLIMSGGEINLDQAAMLTSATLELGLRTLARRHRMTVSEDNDSLAGLAIALGQSGQISQQDQRQIQYYASCIRNRVMHGQLGVMKANEVASFHQLARRCLANHGIA